ncbi:MAG: hypothetical protein VKM98_07640 [Cyanobacteriota bacterium]|nr:hypothetical protein [Cyanobacteriota bacterium]
MALRLVPNDDSGRRLNPAEPMRLVSEALGYFAQHFSETDALGRVAATIGTSDAVLDFSFDQIRGMTPAEALLDHRLNQLFQSLTVRPRQGLGSAIRACGLGSTNNVVRQFETTFGIEMPLFLLTCRRAAEDRLFRQAHPEAEALVLPS